VSTTRLQAVATGSWRTDTYARLATKLDTVVATERARIQASARDIGVQAAKRILGREVASS